jgi:DNA replication protein DnaC
MEKLANFNIEHKTVIYHCEIHGEQESTISCLNGEWSPPYCNLCLEERKRKEQEAEEQKKKIDQERKRELVKQSNLINSQIPPRFLKASFDNYKTTTKEQGNAKKTCFDYASNFENKLETGTGLVFVGTYGTGKTHLACSIAQEIMKKGYSALYVNTSDVIEKITATWGVIDGGEKKQQAMNYFINPDLLILDEIGLQHGSEAEKVELSKIINKRYLQLKPTILISNLDIKDLKEYVTERVVDRMREGGGQKIVFNWESNRGQ